jgi:uncharacterized protein
MSAEYLALLLAGAAAGGFINGLAGFGTALLALGFWLQIMSPLQAVSLVVIISVFSGVQGLWIVRASIFDQPRRLARFLIPSLFGIPAGVALLSVIDAGLLKLVIAGFLILYGGFFSLRRALPRLERPTHVIDATVGFLGGLLGGAASLSGALPTMWCAMRPWTKSQTRAVLQPYNVVVLGLTAILLTIKGAYTPETLLRVGITLPVAIVFAQVGIGVFKRLSDYQFRRLLIGMMFFAGVILLAREML